MGNEGSFDAAAMERKRKGRKLARMPSPLRGKDPSRSIISSAAEKKKRKLIKMDSEEEEFDDAVTASILSKFDSADGDDDDSDSEEPFQKLIEPFTKSQLSDLLREAAEKNSDVLDSIRKLADVHPAHRKIFVHGLGCDTNVETLITVFKQYGEIEDVKVVIDKITGRSKGYGFILFKHRSGAGKALKEPQKKIGNWMTACQLASVGPPTAQVKLPVPLTAPAPAPAQAAPPVSEYTRRKIYVSNVSADIDPQKLLGFFSKFGEIEEGPLGLDKQSGKPKGFALFIYRSSESARKALEEPHKNFEGYVLHCQKAIDSPYLSRRARAAPGMQYNHQGSQLVLIVATQGGAGLGLTIGGYQPGMHVGYPNSQMGQPNAGRSQPGGAHMGH